MHVAESEGSWALLGQVLAAVHLHQGFPAEAVDLVEGAAEQELGDVDHVCHLQPGSHYHHPNEQDLHEAESCGLVHSPVSGVAG